MPEMPRRFLTPVGTVGCVPFFQRPERPPPDEEPFDSDFTDATDVYLGGVVPFEALLARSETGAVALRGLVAYPDGFELTVVAYARSDPGGRRRRRFRGAPMMFDPFDLYEDEDDDELPPEFLRFGIEFPDGVRVSNLTPPWPPSPDATEPMHGLEPQGGGGNDAMYEQEFWAWPLPSEGRLAFACEWPLHGIPETTIEVDAALLHEAANRAQPVWPDALGGRSHMSRAAMFSRVREVHRPRQGFESDQTDDA